MPKFSHFMKLNLPFRRWNNVSFQLIDCKLVLFEELKWLFWAFLCLLKTQSLWVIIFLWFILLILEPIFSNWSLMLLILPNFNHQLIKRVFVLLHLNFVHYILILQGNFFKSFSRNRFYLKVLFKQIKLLHRQRSQFVWGILIVILRSYLLFLSIM